MKRWLIIFLLMFAAGAASVLVSPVPRAWAQADANPPAGKSAKTVVRMYDISDLLHPPPDFPFDSSVLPPTMVNMPRNRSAVAPVQAGGLFGNQGKKEKDPAGNLNFLALVQ